MAHEIVSAKFGKDDCMLFKGFNQGMVGLGIVFELRSC